MCGVAMPAFALAYMARWARRSNVMTAAEWMKTRFGDDTGGCLARYAAAIMAIVFTAGTVGYAFQGIGKFALVYFPLGPLAAHLPFGGQWIVEHQADLRGARLSGILPAGNRSTPDSLAVWLALNRNQPLQVREASRSPREYHARTVGGTSKSA
jgi:hypothetical protein